MVGDFSGRAPSYDPNTEKLVLKPEYIGVGQIVKVMGQTLITMDSETTDPSDYPYYFHSGLEDIFDIIPL